VNDFRKEREDGKTTGCITAEEINQPKKGRVLITLKSLKGQQLQTRRQAIGSRKEARGPSKSKRERHETGMNKATTVWGAKILTV